MTNTDDFIDDLCQNCGCFGPVKNGLCKECFDENPNWIDNTTINQDYSVIDPEDQAQYSNRQSAINHFAQRTHSAQKTLQKYTYTGNPINCSICIEQIKAGCDVATLPCAHTFHFNCIFHWLEVNDKCPLCRTSAVGWSNFNF